MKGIYKNPHSDKIVEVISNDDLNFNNDDCYIFSGEDNIGNTYQDCYCRWIRENWELIYA